jgi:hypothetical protein
MRKPIPLEVLVNADAAMKMLREVADEKLTGEQFMQALRSWSALHAEIVQIQSAITCDVVA